MVYDKARAVWGVLFAVVLMLTGCKDKGEAFVGNWIQTQVKEGRKPASLDIELDDGIFHINYKWHNVFTVTEFDNTLRERKLEAKAESDNVLNVIATPNQTMRMNNDFISFDNKEFKRVILK